jgi:hypothetical protein
MRFMRWLEVRRSCFDSSIDGSYEPGTKEVGGEFTVVGGFRRIIVGFEIMTVGALELPSRESTGLYEFV